MEELHALKNAAGMLKSELFTALHSTEIMCASVWLAAIFHPMLSAGVDFWFLVEESEHQAKKSALDRGGGVFR